MWIPWSDEEAAQAERALRGTGLTALADKVRDELAFRRTPAATELADTVRNTYVRFSDGELDVDDKVAISPSDDGAYVLAWLWLDNEEMGVTTHRVVAKNQNNDVVFTGTEEQCKDYVEDWQGTDNGDYAIEPILETDNA